MASAPRPSKKAQKILENIIGRPPAMITFRLSKESKRLQQLLNYKSSRMAR